MRGRRTVTRKPAKTQRRSTMKLKRNNAPTAARPASSTLADLQEQVSALTRELAQAREQQTATSEVLSVISASPGELEPVFQAMLESATRLCEAKFGNLFLYEGGGLRLVATHNVPAAFAQARRRGLLYPAPGGFVAEAIRTKQMVQVADLASTRAYAERQPTTVEGVELGGIRTAVAVPMLKGNELIGIIVIYRQEVRPFTDKQIELLTNFASQAVIAIENARLLNELRQRTGDLSEALDTQTAMSEVLGVISSSPSDLEPVFQAIVESAARLCEAYDVAIWRPEGDQVRLVAHHGSIAVESLPLIRETVAGRTVLDRQTLHIADLQSEIDEFPKSSQNARSWGIHSLLCVPLMREGVAIGAIALRRREIQLFTDKQIALVQNFASQAVIAIENTRLLNELHQRTDDLSEALERQTATSEVLKVVSSSPGELGPVFQAMLQTAVRICEAKFGTLYLREGDAFRTVSMHNAPPAFIEQRERDPLVRPRPDVPLGQVASTKQVVHVADSRELQAYIDRDPFVLSATDLGGYRTIVCVPMLKEKELVGAISIYRSDVRLFSNKQIELVQNFAAQAVIAIENTRLLNELRELLEQQTATADVLRVISSSPGELGPVFQTMLENAARVCEAKFGNIFTLENGAMQPVASLGEPEPLTEFFQKGPHRPHEDAPAMRVARTKQPVHVIDFATERAYIERNRLAIAAVELGGIRTLLVVPMLKENELIGAFAVYRQEVRPFTDKQIELIKNFAAQAVIAIENTRLLNELRQRTNDLSEALEQQTATSEVLSVISRSRGELELVFQAILENATRICEASFGNLLLYDGDVFRRVALHNAPQPWAADVERDPIIPRTVEVLYRIAETKQLIHVADFAMENPDVPIVRFAGARTVLVVPMLRESVLVGAIGIYRQEVRPFTDKQVELVQNFAAQAVIAIENARLLNELRELLQQQTATAEVLGVISRSPGELTPVFETMLANAVRLCEARFGMLFLHERGALCIVATHNVPPEVHEARRSFQPHADGTLGKVLRTKQTVHVDLASTRAYAERHPATVEAVELGGIRTNVGVPMLKDEEVVGVIVVHRQEVRPFSDKQIELVENFAAQAVIAIENTRLLRELRESLQQQTATADVLKVISRSTFDLQTVLDTLVASAARLCETECAFIHLREDEAYHLAASHGFSEQYRQFTKDHPIVPGRGTLVGRTVLEGHTVHISDVSVDPEYTWTEAVKRGGLRTMLGVPLLRGGTPIGVMGMHRLTVRPFTDKQIELVTTFADQAVIAIENVRLFDEVQARTRDLSESLQQQTATADVLKVISRSTFDLHSVLNTLVEFGMPTL